MKVIIYFGFFSSSNKKRLMRMRNLIENSMNEECDFCNDIKTFHSISKSSFLKFHKKCSFYIFVSIILTWAWMHQMCTTCNQMKDIALKYDFGLTIQFFSIFNSNFIGGIPIALCTFRIVKKQVFQKYSWRLAHILDPV